MFKSSLEMHLEAFNTLYNMQEVVENASIEIDKCVKKGGTVYWMGNGGSAADAQHYAAELMVRYKLNRKPIKSIALTTDTSLITAHSNDFEFETVFSRQVEALASSDDVFIGISTSGNSENIKLAMQTAKHKNCLTIGMLGNDGGQISKLVDISLIVANSVTANIQECHLIIGHYICDFIEKNNRQ